MNGMVKTMDDGNGGKIKLVGNALTFVIYKSYFGRDLLNDIVAFAKRSVDAATVRRLGDFNVQSVEDVAGLTAEERNALLTAVGEYTFDSEFVLNFIAALMATARYPTKPDITDLIVEIPPWWIADKVVVSELMEFLSLFITRKKALAGGGGL
jgi:hypothetical protein